MGKVGHNTPIMTQKKFSVVAGLAIFGVSVLLLRSHWCGIALASCGPNLATSSLASQIEPRYYVYSPQTLALAQQSDAKVVLYFWAPWCSTCASLEQDIHKDPNLIPKDVIIVRVDYDHDVQLKQQYHITLQHTFVQIDQHGNPLQTWVGGTSNDLQERLK